MKSGGGEGGVRGGAELHAELHKESCRLTAVARFLRRPQRSKNAFTHVSENFSSCTRVVPANSADACVRNAAWRTISYDQTPEAMTRTATVLNVDATRRLLVSSRHSAAARCSAATNTQYIRRRRTARSKSQQGSFPRFFEIVVSTRTPGTPLGLVGAAAAATHSLRIWRDSFEYPGFCLIRLAVALKLLLPFEHKLAW